jgi:hypothetical protein
MLGFFYYYYYWERRKNGQRNKEPFDMTIIPVRDVAKYGSC